MEGIVKMKRWNKKRGTYENPGMRRQIEDERMEGIVKMKRWNKKN